MESRIVVDTSAVIAVLLGEPIRDALIALTVGASLIAPPSLPVEVSNALIAGYRRKSLSSKEVLGAWSAYQDVKVRLVEIDVESALSIAIESGIYAYDAYMLEAARAERLPLLTLDKGMARAARQLGLRLMEVEE